METIQYQSSLKNKNTYSIGLNSIITNSTSNTNNTSETNNIFDKHCIDSYGKKTCILFYIDNDTVEVRLLDTLSQIKNKQITPFRIIKKESVFIEIPNFLQNKYTVIVVETIDSSINTKEITAIHLPPV